MTLETRRIRAYLIEVFKILRGIAGAEEGMGLVRDEGGRRGHDHKLYINSVRLDVGKLMFSRPFSPLGAVEESNFSFAVLGMLGMLGIYVA